VQRFLEFGLVENTAAKICLVERLSEEKKIQDGSRIRGTALGMDGEDLLSASWSVSMRGDEPPK
jgi:hypothetical protein